MYGTPLSATPLILGSVSRHTVFNPVAPCTMAVPHELQSPRCFSRPTTTTSLRTLPVRGTLLLVLACCCVALVLLPAATNAAAVEMAPSVMVVGEYDWVPYQSSPPYTSRWAHRGQPQGSTRPWPRRMGRTEPLAVRSSVNFSGLLPEPVLAGPVTWPRCTRHVHRTACRCTDMVNRAAAARSTIINFYPTHYWRGDAATVKSFCYMDT